jgi:hypothetical protein
MNERIKQLLEQAGITYAVMPKDTVYEKFAELIVQDCMDVVNDAVDHREPASTYVGKIKEHFGVK